MLLFSNISNAMIDVFKTGLLSGLWVSVTLCIWWICVRIARKMKSALLANPLFLGIVALCLLLPLVGVDAGAYLSAVKPLTFLVSLATVALALPLWQQRKLIVSNARAMAAATLAATLSGLGSAWAIGMMLGLSLPEVASIGPKMTTLAVALPLSRSTGGWDNLAMLCVMCNGVGGASISSLIWRVFLPKSTADDRAFALGATSHAMGIARTMTITPEFVSLATCGMLLSALFTTAVYGFAKMFVLI